MTCEKDEEGGQKQREERERRQREGEKKGKGERKREVTSREFNPEGIKRS